MKGATPDDQEIADIILYLLATEQECHVYHTGYIEIRPGRHTNKRRRRRNPQTISKAEAKRLRKQMKRMS